MDNEKLGGATNSDLYQSKIRPGTLKIFFGYAAGVGKTYAMLSAAMTAKKAGVDVVVGYVEPHSRPETQALLEGLEELPVLQVPYKNVVLRELDLDVALKRAPKLILVDEMAHSNAQGCRHLKRYQDIQELLRHGIDVYTTVNVQHVESLNDLVESITGVVVRERIPDSLFDSADHVELVDIEPEDLLERLQKGKIYKLPQAQKAMGNFFTKENLVALREISLRRTADIVNKAVEKHKALRRRSDYSTSERVLVCLSSSPSNPKVIRTATRMADAFHGTLTALFVENAATQRMSEDNKTRLNAHVKLAEQLGAKIVTVEGDDVPYQVAEYAKTSGISKIVIGRSGNASSWLAGQNFIDKLTELAPHLDTYVIPNQLRHQEPAASSWPSFLRLKKFDFSFVETAKCFGGLAGSTVVGFVFDYFSLSESNIIMAYILGALLAALLTEGLFYSAIYAIGSILAFNYFFTEPRFTFQVYDPGHPVTFSVMLLVSGIISTLAKRLKQQKNLASQKAYRTSILLETSQKLTGAKDVESILGEAASQLLKLLDRTVIFYPVVENGLGNSVGNALGEPIVIERNGRVVSASENSRTSINERAVAEWVFENSHQAGAGTNTLPGAQCLYMAVRGQESALAVMALDVKEHPLDAFEKGLFLAVLNECSLALEKEQIRETRNRISMQAKQETLRANLLRAISHDLRTPLTSISGNASLLLYNGNELDDDKKSALHSAIYDDAVWLNNLVENILSITRLDDGSVNLNIEPELVADLIQEALQHISRRNIQHVLNVNIEDELLMAEMDAPLIIQVLVNLIDNAIKYTPPGSNITITARKKEDLVEVSVSDDGEGIPDAAKEKLFDMFVTVKSAAADSRRGLGLGLSLCKSIVSAHGGEIWVTDNIPKGATFSFTLKATELKRA